MAKLKDVAEKANVSLATASLALNDSNLISIKTKEKVKLWAERLDYYPNIYAQRLAKGKSYNISLLLNSNTFYKSPNIYYLRVLSGMIGEAKTAEYTINFAFYGEQKKDLISFKKSDLNIKNVDGIIIFDVIEEHLFEQLMDSVDVPVLLVDNHRRYPDVYGVDNDDFGGAYKAVKYLINLGHREIGFIGVSDEHPITIECWNGFCKALKESGLKSSVVYKKSNFGIKSGRRAIQKLLDLQIKLPSAFSA